jgi:hypothetical protein
MMDEGVVQVLELPEMKLIGLSITCSFIGHETERIEAMKREQYAHVKSKGDPYVALHSYVREKDLHSNDRALAIEVYQFANPTWPDEVDMYIPLR